MEREQIQQALAAQGYELVEEPLRDGAPTQPAEAVAPPIEVVHRKYQRFAADAAPESLSAPLGATATAATASPTTSPSAATANDPAAVIVKARPAGDAAAPAKAVILTESGEAVGFQG